MARESLCFFGNRDGRKLSVQLLAEGEWGNSRKKEDHENTRARKKRAAGGTAAGNDKIQAQQPEHDVQPAGEEAVYCILRTAYCILHTAYCILCTAYCVPRTLPLNAKANQQDIVILDDVVFRFLAQQVLGFYFAFAAQTD